MHPPRLPDRITRRLRLPLVAAPMFGVSGIDLVVAACRDQAEAEAEAAPEGPRRWRDIWSAGHSVSGVRAVQSVDALVAEVEQEYHHAGR